MNKILKIPSEAEIEKKERRLRLKYYQKFTGLNLICRLVWAWKNPKINARYARIKKHVNYVEVVCVGGGGGGTSAGIGGNVIGNFYSVSASQMKIGIGIINENY